MAVAPAAPEILVVSDLLIGFVFLVTFAVLAGILWTYRNTFGWLFETIGNVSVGSYPIVGTIRPFRILLAIDHAFVSALGAAAAKQEQLAGRFFHAAAVVQGWIVRELRDFAVEVWKWRSWLEGAFIPAYLAAKIAAAVKGIGTTKVVKIAARATATTVERVVTKRIGITRADVEALIRKAVAATGAIAVPIPHILPRLRDLERTAENDAKRLRRLGWAGAFTGAVGLVLAALARLGLNWIRCRNVKDAGRAVCRLDTSLLNELLTDGLLFFGAVSVVEFAKELRTIEDEAVKVLGGLVREWPS